MKLAHKVLVLAVVPLLVSLTLIAWAFKTEQQALAEGRRLQLRTAFMSTREEELRHQVALAMSTISPLYNQGLDDAATKKQVMAQLAHLDYGPDGYFFLFNMEGVNLMHPRQRDLVGKNLIDMRDSRGEPTIRMLLERARTGGGFVVYRWMKPSTQVEAPKLGYVTMLSRWGWMVGTGMYLDDVETLMHELDVELERNVQTTLLWIAGAGALGMALIFACALVLSVTEHKVSDAKLALLARKVVQSQEEERAHLSRELHDGTGQTLVVVKLLVESALDRMEGASAAVRNPLVRALERLKEALVDVRGMSHRLRPVMLDTLGLPAALQNLGEETCSEAGVVFLLEQEGDIPDLPDDVKTMLFRITQEALSNIQKHAQAEHVNVRLSFHQQWLRLSIRDDGRGFDAAAMRDHPRRGIGLHNMRERIETLGGQLDVLSQPGRTEITASLTERAIQRLRVQA